MMAMAEKGNSSSGLDARKPDVRAAPSTIDHVWTHMCMFMHMCMSMSMYMHMYMCSGPRA